MRLESLTRAETEAIRWKNLAKLLGIWWAFEAVFGSRWRVVGDSLPSG